MTGIRSTDSSEIDDRRGASSGQTPTSRAYNVTRKRLLSSTQSVAAPPGSLTANNAPMNSAQLADAYMAQDRKRRQMRANESRF